MSVCTRCSRLCSPEIQYQVEQYTSGVIQKDDFQCPRCLKISEEELKKIDIDATRSTEFIQPDQCNTQTTPKDGSNNTEADTEKVKNPWYSLEYWRELDQALGKRLKWIDNIRDAAVDLAKGFFKKK